MLSGLVRPEKIEEMSEEMSKVIEDFDRAVNVETLRTAKEIGKHSILSQSGHSLFSVISCRASAFAWAV